MLRTIIALAAALGAAGALAQGAYPTRPVTTMVGFAPGFLLLLLRAKAFPLKVR